MHFRHAYPKCKCDMRDMHIVCISETHTRDAYPTCTCWSGPGGRRFVLGLTYIYRYPICRNAMYRDPKYRDYIYRAPIYGGPIYRGTLSIGPYIYRDPI